MRSNNMEKNVRSNRNKTVETIAISAIMIAIMAILNFVPNVGYIKIIPNVFEITIIHLFVLIFAWMFGWKYGFLSGALFGIFCFINAFIIGNIAFQNPIVAILPRILFGFLAGIAFELLKLIKKPRLRFTLDAIMCGVLTAAHTFMVLIALYLAFYDSEVFSTYMKMMLASIAINFPVETAAAVIIVPAVILALDKAFPRYQAVYHSTLKRRKSASVYETITSNYHDDLIENLGKFVAIDSVYDEKTVSKKDPFGKGVSEALDFIASLAKKDGFEVTNYANKVVEITVGSGKNITILAHADVVPAGTGWNQNPFEMVDRGDKLTGRGVADDKGPLLAAYYAMKAIRDNHMLGDYQIRFIVGGNEESGSAGVEYFFKTLKKPQPDFGFSPDAEYPLIFAEKGIINFEVKKKVTCKHLISIKGGVASNSVIEKCVVIADNDPDFIKFIVDNHYDAKYEEDEAGHLVITFNGKAAHGSTPEEGVNAGLLALKACANYYTNKDLLDLYAKYSNLQGYGIDAFGNSDEMGHNTLNVGIISYEENQFSMIVNFRYVDTCQPDDLKFNIKNNSKPFAVEFLGDSPLLYYPKDSTLIQTLLNAYREETGDTKSEPKAIGGGTYAKEADNVVAFGMEFPGWNSYMHSPGEQVKKADLFKSISIYAKAIVDLGKKLEERHEN